MEPFHETHEYLSPDGLEIEADVNEQEQYARLIVKGGEPGKTCRIIRRTHTIVGPYDETINVVIRER